MVVFFFLFSRGSPKISGCSDFAAASFSFFFSLADLGLVNNSSAEGEAGVVAVVSVVVLLLAGFFAVLVVLVAAFSLAGGVTADSVSPNTSSKIEATGEGADFSLAGALALVVLAVGLGDSAVVVSAFFVILGVVSLAGVLISEKISGIGSDEEEGWLTSFLVAVGVEIEGDGVGSSAKMLLAVVVVVALVGVDSALVSDGTASFFDSAALVGAGVVSPKIESTVSTTGFVAFVDLVVAAVVAVVSFSVDLEVVEGVDSKRDELSDDLVVVVFADDLGESTAVVLVTEEAEESNILLPPRGDLLAPLSKISENTLLELAGVDLDLSR